MVLPPAADPRAAECWTDSINSSRSGKKMPLPGESMPAAHAARPPPSTAAPRSPGCSRDARPGGAGRSSAAPRLRRAAPAAGNFTGSLRRSNMPPHFARLGRRIEYGISMNGSGRHNRRRKTARRLALTAAYLRPAIAEVSNLSACTTVYPAAEPGLPRRIEPLWVSGLGSYYLVPIGIPGPQEPGICQPIWVTEFMTAHETSATWRCTRSRNAQSIAVSKTLSF